MRTLSVPRPRRPSATCNISSAITWSCAGARKSLKTSNRWKFSVILSTNAEEGLAWPTVSKIWGIMLQVYKVGLLHGLVKLNPVVAVESRLKTNYRAIVLSPMQTLAVLQRLQNPVHIILVLTCAATALRASELLALRWADIRREEDRIRVSKRWSKGKDGATKNEASDGYVPMHPVLAAFLQEWHSKTTFGGKDDFVFPSLRSEGEGRGVTGHLRRRPSPAGRQSDRDRHRGRTALRAAQSAAFA